MRTPFWIVTEVLRFRWREPLLAVLLLFVSFPCQAVAQDVCPDMRVTRNVFGPEIADLSSATRPEVGPNGRPAEWSEVKACYERFGLNYFHKLGLGKGYPNNRVLVLRNGERYAGAGRAYFAAFHEGNLPPSFLAYDNVGGNQISLGSWHDQLPVLYVVCNAANGKCPAVGTVPLSPPFVSPSSDSWFNFGMKHPVLLAIALFLICVIACTIYYIVKSITQRRREEIPTKYYPLLFKAIQSLDRNTPEARRDVYDRARAMLARHLRSTSPPMSKMQIVGEELALKAAIDCIEREVHPAGLSEQGNLRFSLPEQVLDMLYPSEKAGKIWFAENPILWESAKRGPRVVRSSDTGNPTTAVPTISVWEKCSLAHVILTNERLVFVHSKRTVRDFFNIRRDIGYIFRVFRHLSRLCAERPSFIALADIRSWRQALREPSSIYSIYKEFCMSPEYLDEWLARESEVVAMTRQWRHQAMQSVGSFVKSMFVPPKSAVPDEEFQPLLVINRVAKKKHFFRRFNGVPRQLPGIILSIISACWLFFLIAGREVHGSYWILIGAFVIAALRFRLWMGVRMNFTWLQYGDYGAIPSSLKKLLSRAKPFEIQLRNSQEADTLLDLAKDRVDAVVKRLEMRTGETTSSSTLD